MNLRCSSNLAWRASIALWCILRCVSIASLYLFSLAVILSFSYSISCCRISLGPIISSIFMLEVATGVLLCGNGMPPEVRVEPPGGISMKGICEFGLDIYMAFLASSDIV